MLKAMTVQLYGFMLLAAYFCSNFVTAELDLKQINWNGLEDKVPAELANTNFTLDNAKSMLRDKCIEVSGETNGTAAYNDIETGFMDFVQCFSNILNFTNIQSEIDEASPHGELDVVFHKYCNKRPAAMECVETLNAKFIPCLDSEERNNQDVFMRIINSLLNFVCHKGGDQIALFIAEKGPECLKSKQDDIQQCINNTFSSYVPADGFENVKKMPKLVFDEKACDNMEKMETCIVNKLETCSEITPANIVESMFRFIKNETLCRGSSKSRHYQHQTGNGGQELMQLHLTTLLLSILLFNAVAKYLQRY